MMDAFEVAGKIFHLPALIRADLLALDAATGTSPLLHAQLVDLGAYRKIFEVGKIPPSLAPLHASKFFLRFGRGGRSSGLTGLRSISSAKFKSNCARSPEDCRRSARGP